MYKSYLDGLRITPSRIGLILGLALASAVATKPAEAVEGAKSVYLLGSNAQLAGIVPPFGTYFYDINYYYSGSAKAAAADSVILEDVGNIERQAKLKVESDAFITIPSVLWVPDAEVFGGRFGFGVLLPIGWQDVSARADVTATLKLPDGTRYSQGSTFKLHDETTAVGDPLLTAFVGWDAGNWHTKFTGLLNIPIGSYSKKDIANMGFNRWAFDATGAVTWLDPMIGFEASVAAGFTFNGENPATNYTSGTEFHVEYALMQHFSQAFALGLSGYHYQQVNGDSGKGATLGDFEGRVSAIGPALTYDTVVGGLPVSAGLRWYHEFDAKNRLQGDAVYGTLTIPF